MSHYTFLHTNKQLFADFLEVFDISEDSNEPLKGGKLAVHPQQHQHEEEQQCPELRHWHVVYGLSEYDECQTRPF